MTLSPSKSEVTRARKFVTTDAHEIEQERLVDVVELLTSELVTNAILHGGDEPLRIAAGPAEMRWWQSWPGAGLAGAAGASPPYSQRGLSQPT